MGVLGEATVKITADSSGFESQARKSILGSMTKIAASVGAIFAGVKIGKALFVDPIKAAGNFEQSLNVLQAASNATNADMKKVSATAVRLGNDVKLPGVSAADAADSMLLLAKAGFDVNESMDAAKGTLLLATAAEIDAGLAAKTVTQNIQAFGLQASDTNTIVDNMAGFVNATGTEFTQFADSLSYVAAPANTVGQSFKETAAQLAILSQNGIEGSMAGTGLRQILMQLGTEGSKASKAFAEMGIQTQTADGKFVGMRAIIEKLQPQLREMTSSQRLKLFKEAFGQTAANQANKLLGTLPSKYDEVSKSIGRQGQAAKLAAAQTKGFNGMVDALKSSLETLQLRIGMAVLPKITQLVKWLGKIASAPSLEVAVKIAVSGITSFAGDLKDSISRALGGRERAIDVSNLAFNVDGEVKTNPGLVAKIRDAIAGAVAMVDWAAVGERIGDAIGSAIEITSDTLNGISDQILAWANGPGGSQAAEAGLVIGLKMLSKLLDPGFWAAHWQLIGGIALSALTIIFPEGKLAQIGVKAVGFLLRPFAALGGRLATLGGDAVVAFAARIESSLGPLAGRIALWIGQAIGTVTTAAVKFMVDLGAKMIEGLINKFAGLGVIMRTLLSVGIVTVIGNLVSAAVAAAGRLVDGVVNMIKSIPEKLSSLPGALKTFVVGAVTGSIEAAAEAAARLGRRIVSGLLGALDGIGSKAREKLIQIVNVVNQVAQDVWSAANRIGARIVSGVLSGVAGLAVSLKNKISGMIGSALGSIDIPGRSPPDHAAAEMVGKPIVQGIINGVEAMKARLDASLYQTVKSGISRGGQAVAEATDETKAIFEKWAENVASRMDAVFKLARTKVEAEFAKAKGQLDKWKAELTPTEALLAAMQAQAAQAAVVAAVDTARRALNDLKIKQAADWAEMLRTQAENLAKLKATQAATTTDRDIAEHEFGQSEAAASPLALNLLQARKDLDAAKAMYAEGKIAREELFAAQDAFDAAQIAAQETDDATKLLQDYETWQSLVKQTAEGNAAILTQEQQDEAARTTWQTEAATARATAEQGVWDALATQHTTYLQGIATTERTQRDAQYEILSAAMKKQFDRTVTGLDNQEKKWKEKLGDIAEVAKKGGKTIGDEFSDAIDAIAKPGGPLEAALTKVGNLVKKYLKLNSPAEMGPLSDLDVWWKKLAPTLIASLDSTAIKGALSDAVTPNSGGFGAMVSRPLQDQELKLNDRELISELRALVAEMRRPGDGGPAFTIVGGGGAAPSVYASKR